MTEDTLPYNINDIVSIITQSKNIFLFIGEEELRKLQHTVHNGEHLIETRLIGFPYGRDDDQGILPTGKPRRIIYNGKLISLTVNPALTKGHAVFEDGTIVYYDRRILK